MSFAFAKIWLGKRRAGFMQQAPFFVGGVDDGRLMTMVYSLYTVDTQCLLLIDPLLQLLVYVAFCELNTFIFRHIKRPPWVYLEWISLTLLFHILPPLVSTVVQNKALEAAKV